MQLSKCRIVNPRLRPRHFHASSLPSHASSRRDLLASTTTMTLGICAAEMVHPVAPMDLEEEVRCGYQSVGGSPVHGRGAWGAASAADDFVTTSSGLKFYDIK